MKRALPLVLLGACVVPAPQPSPPYIAPLDGQTAVAPGLDLLVSTGGLALPPDYPVHPDTIRVIDLEDGGLVMGEAWRSGSKVHFTPKAEWVVGHTYAWTVTNTPSDTRQPEQVLLDEILGAATFRAGDGAEVLDAGIDEDGALCLLLSRAVQDIPPDLSIEIADEAVDGVWELREEWGPDADISLLPEDPGVSLACLLDAGDLPAGTLVRTRWGERERTFALEVVASDELAVEERRRAAP